MTDTPVSQSLTPVFPSYVQVLLDDYHLPRACAAHLTLNDQLADMMQARNLTYLELPPLIASVAASPLYERALCYGRGWYFDAMHTVDEQGQVIRDPLYFDRSEIFEMVKDGICPQEKCLLFQPIAWRVGFAVGWLSALAVSQREDVQAAMVMLAALVAPLLIAQPVTKLTKKPVTKPARSKQLPAKAKSKLSRKQSKKR